ncbi:MAG: succinate dehydrogenase [Mucispirillum sp.]|nr:succinate dehydrogenase [Mucispirillum sp.]
MPRRDYKPDNGYKWHPGMQAWVFHRITGLLLVLYFILHMLGSGGVCSFLPNIVQNVYVEGAVVVMFAWHAMNGLRIIFMEFCGAAEKGNFKKALVVFTLLAVLMSLVGLYYVNNARIEVAAAEQVQESRI